MLLLTGSDSVLGSKSAPTIRTIEALRTIQSAFGHYDLQLLRDQAVNGYLILNIIMSLSQKKYSTGFAFAPVSFPHDMMQVPPCFRDIRQVVNVPGFFRSGWREAES